MDLRKDTKKHYDILIELGILQNVKEIDSMNYGWDETAGRLRSRKKYIGNVDEAGLVYSQLNFDHTKFSVKRDDMDLQGEGNVHPYGLIFGVDEIDETDSDGNPYLSYDLWMFMTREAAVVDNPEDPTLSTVEETSDGFNVETIDSHVQGPTKAVLEGSVTDMGSYSSVEAFFKYSKYHQETWWINTDPHIAYGNDYSADDLAQAVTDNQKLGGADYSITLGDIVENRANGVPEYKEEMRRLDYPWTFILGNHDVDGGWWDDPDEAPLVTDPRWGSKIISGVRFIWLSDEGDGNWDYNGGYDGKMWISDEQNEWFKSLMDDDPDIPTVLLTHQGPALDDSSWGWEYRPDFWDLNERGWLRENIDSYNVVAWIHGHRHEWLIDEDHGGYGFDRISVDSVDKDTDSNKGMYMDLERIAGETRLYFTFRDQANEQWESADGYADHEIVVSNGLSGWQETSRQTIDTEETFSEQLTNLGKGEDYVFVAAAEDDSGTELDRGSQLTFETKLIDLTLAQIHYDPEVETWSLQKNYKETSTRALEWGMIYERAGNEVKLYAEEDSGLDEPPKTCLMEYEFLPSEIGWTKPVMGLWGFNAHIHTALGYARYEYGVNGDYEDYEVTWKEDGTMGGSIEMNRDQELVDELQGGAQAFIYSHPHSTDVAASDLYGDRTQLFNGYVTDLSDKGDSLSMSLEGALKDLDRDENVVLVEDIDQTTHEDSDSVDTLDAFDTMKYIFSHASRLRNFDHTVKGGEWHDQHDRIFSVNGNLFNAAMGFSYFMDMIMRAQFVEEGTFVDVDLNDPKSGESVTVKTEDLTADPGENIIQDFELEKDIGVNEYVNKIKGEALLSSADENWRTLREDRLSRLLGDELILSEENTMRFAQMVSTKEEISDIVEEALNKQQYSWTGKLELAGHHHDLGGMNRQGTIRIEHSKKNIYDEYRIAEFTITPGSTELIIANKARERTESRDAVTRSDIDFMLNRDVINALEDTAFELWEDSVGFFDIESINEAKLIGGDGLDITDWATVHTSNYKAYRYIDCKFSAEGFKGDSDDLSPDSIVLRNTAGQTKVLELPNFYKHGVWTLLPDPWGTGSIQYDYELFGNIGMVEDHYDYEVLDGYFVLGDISGALGDPAAGGGILGDPRGEEFIPEEE